MSTETKRTVAMVSLGCPKNLVDAEVMLGYLDREGFVVTTDEKDAEVIIVNTCGFIREAKQESIDTILELADRKHDGRCRILVVAGCLPQRYQEELSNQLPEVDIFVGAADYPRIAELIATFDSADGQIRAVSDPDYTYDHRLPRLHSSPRHTAYLKIAEGCSNCCSYCAIPSIRGRYRSRPLDLILEEAREMAALGVKEINLVAQDITRYGTDLAPPSSLTALLRELVQIDGIRWIRLLYAYPDGITDELIQLVKREEKICKYLDIPLQHISDPVLARMNRRSTEDEQRYLIERLRAEIPGIVIRTSLIVGFPGETDDDFRKLLQFVETARFDRLGVFCYSREEGTPAASMPDQVPERIKKERYRKVMRTQARVSFRRNRELVGTTVPVIVEGYSDETDLLLKGRTMGQAPDIDGQVYVTSGTANVGDIVTVKITDSSDYDLIGEMVE